MGLKDKMTTNKELIQREVSRIDTPKVETISGAHRLRVLVPPGNWAETDPFLVLVEDWFSALAFDDHPHRGFETVTYMIDGTTSHLDNHGNTGLTGPGEALWLTAGRGIVHNEVPVGDVHLLQLWVNLPRAKKNVYAKLQEMKTGNTPRRSLPGAEVVVFSGRSGEVESPIRNHAKVTMIEVRLEPNAVFSQELPGNYNGFVVVLNGAGTVGATTVSGGQIARLKRESVESQVKFAGGEDGMRVMLYAGLPLNEPVVVRGPFVMNTDEEIILAYEEFREQGERFGLEGSPFMVRL